MRTIIETALSVLKSGEIASAASISPSADWGRYHVTLCPFKESLNPGFNLGRLPIIKVATISQNYTHESSPEWGGERSTSLAIDVFVVTSTTDPDDSYYQLSRIVNVICQEFSQNVFLSVEEIDVGEASELNQCVGTRIVMTLKSVTDQNFSEGD
jgi:hypothetical protein